MTVALLAAGLLAASRPAAAAPRVAVVVAVAANLPRADAVALTDTMADALRQKLAIEVFSGPDVERRLPDRWDGPNCIAKPRCVSALIARLEVDEILFMVVARVGERIQVEVSRSTATGGVTSGPTLMLEASSQPLAVFTGAVEVLLPGAPERPAAPVAPPAELPPSVQIEPTPAPEPSVPAHRPPSAATPAAAPSTDFEPRPSARRSRAPAWITIGIATLAAGAGTVLGISAWRERNQLREECGTAGCADARVDRVDRLALAADVSFAMAALSAGVATYLFLRAGRDDAPRVGAAPRSGGAALVLEVGF